jgi:hypothetical protein
MLIILPVIHNSSHFTSHHHYVFNFPPFALPSSYFFRRTNGHSLWTLPPLRHNQGTASRYTSAYGNNNNIIISHKLGVDKPVSALPNTRSLFRSLPKMSLSIRLETQHYFGIRLFVIWIFRSQFDLYIPSFWSNGSTFNSSKISSFLLI